MLKGIQKAAWFTDRRSKKGGAEEESCHLSPGLAGEPEPGPLRKKGEEECRFLSAVFYIGLQFVAFTCVWTHVNVWSMEENPQVSSKEFQTLSTAVTDVLAKGPYAPTRYQAYRYCEIISRKWANTFTSSHHTTAKQAHHTTETHTPQHTHHSTCIDK